jgi:hypothetical protein
VKLGQLGVGSKIAQNHYPSAHEVISGHFLLGLKKKITYYFTVESQPGLLPPAVHLKENEIDFILLTLYIERHPTMHTFTLIFLTNLIILVDIYARVGFLPGRKVFLPFPWEEMGFYREETLSSGKKWKKLPRDTVNLTIF